MSRSSLQATTEEEEDTSAQQSEREIKYDAGNVNIQSLEIHTGTEDRVYGNIYS